VAAAAAAAAAGDISRNVNLSVSQSVKSVRETRGIERSSYAAAASCTLRFRYNRVAAERN
jgi:hypothetical protein